MKYDVHVDVILSTSLILPVEAEHPTYTRDQIDHGVLYSALSKIGIDSGMIEEFTITDIAMIDEYGREIFLEG